MASCSKSDSEQLPINIGLDQRALEIEVLECIDVHCKDKAVRAGANIIIYESEEDALAHQNPLMTLTTDEEGKVFIPQINTDDDFIYIYTQFENYDHLEIEKIAVQQKAFHQILYNAACFKDQNDELICDFNVQFNNLKVGQKSTYKLYNLEFPALNLVDTQYINYRLEVEVLSEVEENKFLIREKYLSDSENADTSFYGIQSSPNHTHWRFEDQVLHTELIPGESKNISNLLVLSKHRYLIDALDFQFHFNKNTKVNFDVENGFELLDEDIGGYYLENKTINGITYPNLYLSRKWPFNALSTFYIYNDLGTLLTLVTFGSKQDISILLELENGI